MPLPTAHIPSPAMVSKIARAFGSSTLLVVESLQTFSARRSAQQINALSTTTSVASKITRAPRVSRKYGRNPSIEVGSKSKGMNPRKDGFKTVRVRGEL
jgi:hypothetical protein